MIITWILCYHIPNNSCYSKHKKVKKNRGKKKKMSSWSCRWYFWNMKYSFVCSLFYIFSY